MLRAPSLSPMLLQRLAEPFNHDGFLFELKYDGFRALAFIVNRECRLVSRNKNQFKNFSTLAYEIGGLFPVTDVVLDGEVCCIDEQGRPQFNELLFRRGTPRFFAFDLLYASGLDLRDRPLIERKERLRHLLEGIKSDSLLYVDHIESRGEDLFRHACDLDLEGIVAKHKHGKYVSEREQSTWFKIRNRNYSQREGREELFEREPAKLGPWDSCAKAAAASAE